MIEIIKRCLQGELHEEAVKTVEAIRTASSAPWWLKAGASEEATQLMQEPAAYLASRIGLAGRYLDRSHPYFSS